MVMVYGCHFWLRWRNSFGPWIDKPFQNGFTGILVPTSNYLFGPRQKKLSENKNLLLYFYYYKRISSKLLHLATTKI